MITLSIDHAKHIVRLRHKDAYFVDAVIGCGIFTKFDDEGRRVLLGQGDTEDAAWQHAALRILADLEFWLDDEGMVRAARPDARMLAFHEDVAYRICGDMNGTEAGQLGADFSLEEAWRAARQHSTVRNFEQQYRPKDEKPKILTRADIEKINADKHACGHELNRNPKCGCMCGTTYLLSDWSALITRGDNNIKCPCVPNRMTPSYVTGEPSYENGQSTAIPVEPQEEAKVAVCPFCGSEPEETHDNDKTYFYVGCCDENCPCQPETGLHVSEDKARSAWNERASVVAAHLPVDLSEVSANKTMCDGCGELIHLVEGEWKRVGREDKQSYCRGSLTQGPYPHRPVSWDAGVEGGKEIPYTKKERQVAVRDLVDEWPELSSKELWNADGDDIGNIAVYLQMKLNRLSRNAAPEKEGGI